MRLYSLAALSLVSLFWTAQQKTTHATRDTTETKLVALANEWTEAINRKDRKKLDELMSPEYALYAWNGKMLASRPVWRRSTSSFGRPGAVLRMRRPEARVASIFAGRDFAAEFVEKIKDEANLVHWRGLACGGTPQYDDALAAGLEIEVVDGTS